MCCDRHRESAPPRRPLISTPFTSTPPWVGESNPPIRLSSVVLPDPDGPISARNSPFGIVRSTPFSTSTRSLPREKNLWTPLMLTKSLIGNSRSLQRHLVAGLHDRRRRQHHLVA